MTENLSDHLKCCAGCGVFLALLASTFGGDETMQWTAFAFGATWGNLWMSHP